MKPRRLSIRELYHGKPTQSVVRLSFLKQFFDWNWMSGCAAVFDWSVAESMYLKLMMMKKKKKRPVFIFKYGLISFYRKVSVHHKNMHGWYIRARPQWSFSGSLVSWQYLYELRGRDCSSDPDMRHNYQLFCYRRVVNNTERKLLHLHVINILSHVSSFAIFAFTCSCYVISKHTVFTSSHKQASQFIVLCLPQLYFG